MLTSPYILGINSSALGKRNPLTKPLTLDSLAERLCQRESKPAINKLTQPHTLSLYPQLIQTSRLLSTAPPDRLYHSNKKSEIGWDNWQAIDRSSDRDDFNYKVDRSRFNIEDRSSTASEIESPALDFFTTVLPTEFTAINPQLDSLPIHPVDLEIPAPVQEPLLGTNSFITETGIDLNLDVPEFSAPDLTQRSRSVVGGLKLFAEGLPQQSVVVGVASPSGEVASVQKNQTASNLVSPPELIPDQIGPNLLDTPTTINPEIPPKVTPLKPAVIKTIIPESVALSPAMPPLEQIATAESTTPDLGFLSRLPSETILPNSLAEPLLQSIDLPSVNVTNPQPPEVATLQPPLLEQKSATSENIISVMPLAVESVSESNSDTWPLDLSDLPITNRPPSTDPVQIGASLDRLAIANLDVLALPSVLASNLPPTTSPLSADRDQIAIAPNQIPSDLQSTQSLIPATNQLNLAADRSNIYQDLDSSTQPEPANLNIPESPSTLPSDFLSTNLFPDPNPEQIATSATPVEIEADLQSTPLVSADTSPLNLLNPNSVNQVPSALEQISTFADEPISVNLESSPTPIVESANTLSVAAISTNPNLTIESIPTLRLDSPQLNMDRSPQENIPLALTEIIAVEQEELATTSIDRNNDNSIDVNIPAPTVGYATGGYVKDANHIDLQSIASSDTVSAMLTPGEFVINAKDAQKNLNLLTHINSGGELSATLPNTEIQPSAIEPVSISTNIYPTLIQRKRNDSLVSPSLQLEIGLEQLASLTNTGLDPFRSSQTDGSNSSLTYSSPSMVFRKPISSPQPQYTGTDTPDQWGSIEDLMNGSNNNLDTFSINHSPQQHPAIQSRSSPIISPQSISPIRGFANGGEVTPSDISTTIAPITHTIQQSRGYANESQIANPQQQSENNDSAELEILAREIYHRLRQRLEIERERHGSYSGNLAW